MEYYFPIGWERKYL